MFRQNYEFECHCWIMYHIVIQHTLHWMQFRVMENLCPTWTFRGRSVDPFRAYGNQYRRLVVIEMEDGSHFFLRLIIQRSLLCLTSSFIVNIMWRTEDIVMVFVRLEVFLRSGFYNGLVLWADRENSVGIATGVRRVPYIARWKSSISGRNCYKDARRETSEDSTN